MFYLLITNTLSRPTAKAVSRKRRQNIASLFFCLFYFLTKESKRFCLRATAKQTTEFGVGVEDTYSIFYQPCISDE